MPPKLPALRPDEVIRALERCGLSIERQRGSHTVLWKDGLRRPVVIARHNRALSPPTIAKILDHAGVDQEDFLRAL